MAKKDVAAKKASAALAARSETEGSAPIKKVTKSSMPLTQSFDDVANAINTTYANYLKTLTPRLKLIDAFLVFLVALGVLQFVYVLLVGNFPFNAFLGGFISCVGQFVLTVSLRMQYALATKNKQDSETESPFPTITAERALGDFVFASLVLHFIVFHFIN